MQKVVHVIRCHSIALQEEEMNRCWCCYGWWGQCNLTAVKVEISTRDYHDLQYCRDLSHRTFIEKVSSLFTKVSWFVLLQIREDPTIGISEWGDVMHRYWSCWMIKGGFAITALALLFKLVPRWRIKRCLSVPRMTPFHRHMLVQSRSRYQQLTLKLMHYSGCGWNCWS